jgi:hypothetical protein
MFGIFLLALLGMSFAGHISSNQDNRQHGQPAQSYGRYLGSGEFAEATFENWESEFLQMAAYVLFTAFLLEKGSPESKRPRATRPTPIRFRPGTSRACRRAPSKCRDGRCGWPDRMNVRQAREPETMRVRIAIRARSQAARRADRATRVSGSTFRPLAVASAHV